MFTLSERAHLIINYEKYCHFQSQLTALSSEYWMPAALLTTSHPLINTCPVQACTCTCTCVFVQEDHQHRGCGSPGLDDLIGSTLISWSCRILASFSGLSRALEGNW